MSPNLALALSYRYDNFEVRGESNVEIDFSIPRNLLFYIHVAFLDKVVFQPPRPPQFPQFDFRMKIVLKMNLVTMNIEEYTYIGTYYI